MQPIVHRLEADYQDQINVVSLNAQQDGKAAFEKAGLPGHPAYLILRPDGEEVWRAFGEIELETLSEQIELALAG